MPFSFQRLLIGASPRRTLVRAVLLGGLAWGVFGHVARPMLVRGASMEPAVRDGGLRFANLLRFRYRPPQRGEVVAIALPGGQAFYAKRILALPGETVGLHAGRLRVDGVWRPEPYVRLAGAWHVPEIRLGADEYFVAGDNRSQPFEEQVAGVVQRRRLAGVLW